MGKRRQSQRNLQTQAFGNRHMLLMKQDLAAAVDTCFLSLSKFEFLEHVHDKNCPPPLYLEMYPAHYDSIEMAEMLVTLSMNNWAIMLQKWHSKYNNGELVNQIVGILTNWLPRRANMPVSKADLFIMELVKTIETCLPNIKQYPNVSQFILRIETSTSSTPHQQEEVTAQHREKIEIIQDRELSHEEMDQAPLMLAKTFGIDNTTTQFITKNYTCENQNVTAQDHLERVRNADFSGKNLGFSSDILTTTQSDLDGCSCDTGLWKYLE